MCVVCWPVWFAADMRKDVVCCENVNQRLCEVNPVNTIPCPNAGLMLGQRRRRWASISPASGECLVFARLERTRDFSRSLLPRFTHVQIASPAPQALPAPASLRRTNKNKRKWGPKLWLAFGSPFLWTGSEISCYTGFTDYKCKSLCTCITPSIGYVTTTASSIDDLML